MASDVTVDGVVTASKATASGVASASVATAGVVRHPVSKVQDFQSNRAEYKAYKAEHADDVIVTLIDGDRKVDCNLTEAVKAPAKKVATKKA